MFIELAEYLKCGSDHAEEPLVVATGAMKERAIVFGTIGCPVCKAEYTIVNRVARFGTPPDAPPPEPAADGEAVQALLGLASAGGYVVLVGSAATLGTGLHARLEGIHFVAVNPPAEMDPAPYMSLLRGERHIPLRSGMARGVVVGAEHAASPWIEECVRVLLKGQRLVVLTEDIAPKGTKPLAAAGGLWVGERK